MRRMQLNLYRDEIDLKHNRTKKTTVRHIKQTADPTFPWWREFDIPKKDVRLFPCGQVCVFCRTSEDCVDKFGEFLRHPFSGIHMHYFCLLLSSGLTQTSDQSKIEEFLIDKVSVCGFLIKDIFQEIKRASRLRCSFCHKLGASIGCVEASCKKKFHYVCGLDYCVLSQFYENFKSYCLTHRPKQTLNLRKTPTTDNLQRNNASILQVSDRVSQCPICLEDIVCSLNNFHVLTTPCCCDFWLHRTCIQQQACSSGLHFFRCPVCNDSELFVSEMLRMGIFIPERDASWELAHDAFGELLQRHSLCDKDPCLCPHGRDYNGMGSRWEIVLCDLCGSNGAHIDCDADVESNMSYYACEVCVSVHGIEGARKLALDLGVPVDPPRRSRRVRRLSAVVDERPKRLRIDMVC